MPDPSPWELAKRILSSTPGTGKNEERDDDVDAAKDTVSAASEVIDVPGRVLVSPSRLAEARDRAVEAIRSAGKFASTGKQQEDQPKPSEDLASVHDRVNASVARAKNSVQVALMPKMHRMQQMLPQAAQERVALSPVDDTTDRTTDVELDTPEVSLKEKALKSLKDVLSGKRQVKLY